MPFTVISNPTGKKKQVKGKKTVATKRTKLKRDSKGRYVGKKRVSVKKKFLSGYDGPLKRHLKNPSRPGTIVSRRSTKRVTVTPKQVRLNRPRGKVTGMRGVRRVRRNPEIGYMPILVGAGAAALVSAGLGKLGASTSGPEFVRKYPNLMAIVGGLAIAGVGMVIAKGAKQAALGNGIMAAGLTVATFQAARRLAAWGLGGPAPALMSGIMLVEIPESSLSTSGNFPGPNANLLPAAFQGSTDARLLESGALGEDTDALMLESGGYDETGDYAETGDYDETGEYAETGEDETFAFGVGGEESDSLMLESAAVFPGPDTDGDDDDSVL